MQRADDEMASPATVASAMEVDVAVNVTAIAIQHSPPSPPYAAYMIRCVTSDSHHTMLVLDAEGQLSNAPMGSTLSAWRRWSQCAAFAKELSRRVPSVRPPCVPP